MKSEAEGGRRKLRPGCLLACFALLMIWCVVGWALLAAMLDNPFPEGSGTALPSELIPSSEDE